MQRLGNAGCREIDTAFCLKRRDNHGAAKNMKQKLLILAVLVIAAMVFFALGLNRYLSFEWIKSTHQDLTNAFAENPFMVAGAFMAILTGAMALSIPGSVLTLALAAGAIFGLWWGIPIVLVGIVVGDSLAFLMARYLFRDWVERRFAQQATMMQRGFERNGAYYLFAMRLAAVIPFFIVNWTMALTRMKLRLFAPVSFLGLVPVTAIYVNAGTQLAQIENPGDIISLPVLVSLGLLGIAPIILRLMMNRTRPAIRQNAA